uniref:Uncharacterized protein n=1 Tax=Lactuca sativa TaxID=4236 RepID=A0A9R1V4W8_LACSA|nr:hypothetical protein LSAT_V11C700372860 [Lactuca sativa]
MIGDVAANSPSNTEDETAENKQQEKPWHSYIYEDLPRTVQESIDSADHVVQYTAQYRSYEDLVFSKIKDQLTIIREHPTLSAGIAITAALLLMRGNIVSVDPNINIVVDEDIVGLYAMLGS